jgi:hypothetical protein
VKVPDWILIQGIFSASSNSRVYKKLIMQRTTTAILAITIAAVIVGYMATNSMLPTTFVLAQSNPPSISDEGGILGHVTYVVKGPDGHVKSYMQTDNQRTVEGINCGLQIMFNPNNGAPLNTNGTATNCTGGQSGTGMILSSSTHFNGFNVIGLINGSGTLTGGSGGNANTGNGTDQPTAVATYGNKCKCGDASAGPRGSAQDGYINSGTVKTFEGFPQQATTITGGPAYNQLTLVSPSFAFSNTSGMTIRGSMLTNSTDAVKAQAFAENALSPTVTVGSGDTLTVTWNLTLS